MSKGKRLLQKMQGWLHNDNDYLTKGNLAWWAFGSIPSAVVSMLMETKK